jgi:hypothetical protein
MKAAPLVRRQIEQWQIRLVERLTSRNISHKTTEASPLIMTKTPLGAT